MVGHVKKLSFVIPATAGNPVGAAPSETPACAGMTDKICPIGVLLPQKIARDDHAHDLVGA
ncbi:MAG: hypothetical protein OSA47_11505, partial [Novosphingopyxis baekryungensis]|nr:hypothetical protein [Novosphingopyxis baekryungensis]